MTTNFSTNCARLTVGRYFLLVIMILSIFLCSGCEEDDPTRLQVGDKVITIEIADTPAERTQGLSDRLFLEDDHGMLFVFPRPSKQSFWMYRCHFDIDMAYIDPDGKILEIIQMKKEPFNTPPNQLKTYPSQSDNVKYVLEMNRGWFKRNNVEPGMVLDLERYQAAY